jgi:hypothetical protein
MTMSREQAARVLLAAAGEPDGAADVDAVLADPDRAADVYRAAAQRTHPDQPRGSDTAFRLVAGARAVIEERT